MLTRLRFVRSPRARRSERHWVKHDVIPRFKLGQFHHQSAIAFIECLKGHREPPATADDGRNALLLISRAYDAARSGVRQLVRQAGGV